MSKNGPFDDRREPHFNPPRHAPRGGELRAGPDERPVPPPIQAPESPYARQNARAQERQERSERPPQRHERYYDDAYDDDEPPPRARRRRRYRDDEGDEEPARKKPSKVTRSILGWMVYWSLVLGVWGLIAGGGLIIYYAGQLPPIDQLAIPKRPPNIAIMADDGSLLANRGDTGGPALHLSDLPPYLPNAFIAIEDRRFYSHYGIDPVGIARALVRNILHRGNVEGGSTLTQQLAKNLFLTQERTLSRKIQEAILALWLEHKYSKDQILELYLNRVYFGSGAYGVEAAANKYFGHSARLVTLPEAAVLAGLMKAPTKLAPNRNPAGATDRAAQVITAMAQAGHITESMAQLALSRPATAKRADGAGTLNYVADYVMDVLDETVGAIDDDITVSTTISPSAQSAAERALTDVMDKQAARYGVTQGALISLDPTGQIKAMIGGRNYADSQFNRVVAAKRQPGSSFKPFVYLTALEHGLTPDTIREDGPINIKGWQPENASHEYQGAVTLTKALAMSLNTVAVRVGLEVGAKNIANTAHRLGITSELQANASIALGTSEVTPLELADAYIPFANGGIAVQPHIILRVRTADGKLLYQRKGASYGRVIDPRYVTMMDTMMQETLLTGTARKADLPGWQAAGKTGTSQDYRDAWFVGFTSHMITAVWIGNDDNSPTKKASGSNLPVDIWSRYMREAHKGIAPTPLPVRTWDGVSPLPIMPSDDEGAGRAVNAPADIVSSTAPQRATSSTQINSAPLTAPAATVPQTGNTPMAPMAPMAPMPLAPPLAKNVQNNAAASQPSVAPQARDPIADLIPPEPIETPAQIRAGSRRTPPSEPDNLLDRLFGGG
jgi:penicillin-binding protein 1A